MPVDHLEMKAGTSDMRANTGNAARVRINKTTGLLVFKDQAGTVQTVVTPGQLTTIAASGFAGVVAKEVTYTENGAGTYTGAVSVPAGATILDIIVNGVALWTAGTSASMEVGDGTDPDGYFTAVDLKATDLLAGESISFALAGGQAGAYIANSQVSPRYAAAARTITGTVVSVGAGTAGRTRMTVVYHLPLSADVTAATQT
jgi:hypothetical protein